MAISMWRGVLALVLTYFALAPRVCAQEVFSIPDQEPAAWNVIPQTSDWDINLAAGAAMLPTYPGSNRYRVIPIPLAIIRWRDMVSLGQDGLNLYWHQNNFRAGGGVTYDGGRLDHQTSGILSGGDNRLMGLGDVDGSVGLRAFASYKFDPVYLDISAIKYLGPQNKGIQVNFGASAPMQFARHFVFRPHVGATWADENYTQTFFGVSAVQAAGSSFPQFNAKAGPEDVNGGVTLVYLFSTHWFLGADASVTRYVNSAGKSPITYSNTNVVVASVVGYHF